MTQQLQEIANQTQEPWAAQRAQYALQICEAVNTGEMPADEGQELMRDLVRMDRLDSESSNMALKTALVTAVFLAANLPI
jgi:polyhydroxyalkanoate synthesis regulator phasin